MDHLLQDTDHHHQIIRNGVIIQDPVAAAGRHLIGISNNNNSSSNILAHISLMGLHLVIPHPMDLTSIIIVDLHRRRILNMVPLHHIMGHQLLRQLVAKLPLKVCLP